MKSFTFTTIMAFSVEDKRRSHDWWTESLGCGFKQLSDIWSECVRHIQEL